MTAEAPRKLIRLSEDQWKRTIGGKYDPDNVFYADVNPEGLRGPIVRDLYDADGERRAGTMSLEDGQWLPDDIDIEE